MGLERYQTLCLSGAIFCAQALSASDVNGSQWVFTRSPLRTGVVTAHRDAFQPGCSQLRSSLVTGSMWPAGTSVGSP